MVTLFNFNLITIPLLLGRFALLLVGGMIVVYLTTLILIHTTKKRIERNAFASQVQLCLMWGIAVLTLCIGIEAFLIIRSNGLYYFSSESFGFSLHCGYIQMLPEVIILIGCFISVCILRNKICRID